MTPDPVIALSVFIGVCLLAYAFVRLRWYDRLRNKSDAARIQLEDVIKQVYHVEASGGTVRLNDLAGALMIDDRVLLEVIESANAKQLVSTTEGTVELTDKGKKEALQVIRKHRLWEKYLSEKTGVDKREWHDRAEIMEHRLSENDIRQLSQELGDPRFDPHGDPIPTALGDIGPESWQTLAGLKVGDKAEIVHLEDEPRAVYRQLLSHKLHVGSHFEVLSADEHGIDILSEGLKSRLSNIVAANVHVQLVTEDQFDQNAIRLSDLSDGEQARVLGISRECRGANRRRLLDLGFINGTQISAEFNSPLNDPRAYLVRNTLIALRNNQADFILVERL